MGRPGWATRGTLQQQPCALKSAAGCLPDSGWWALAPPAAHCRRPHTISAATLQARYAVDEVRYVDELAAVLAELAPPALHVLTGGVNTDRWVGDVGGGGGVHGGVCADS